MRFAEKSAEEYLIDYSLKSLTSMSSLKTSQNTRVTSTPSSILRLSRRAKKNHQWKKVASLSLASMRA